MCTWVLGLTGDVTATRARAVAWQRATAMATAAPCIKGVKQLRVRARVRARVRVGSGLGVGLGSGLGFGLGLGLGLGLGSLATPHLHDGQRVGGQCPGEAG
jgi:hypothetical protein